MPLDPTNDTALVRLPTTLDAGLDGSLDGAGPGSEATDHLAQALSEPLTWPLPEPRVPHGGWARLLLVGVFLVGLLGLSVTSGAPSAPAPVPPAASLALADAAQITAIVPQAPRTVPRAASRSRSAAARPAAKAVKPAVKPAAPRPVVSRGPKWVPPASTPVVSSYGPRWGRVHQGLDFGARYGAPIKAIGDGVVVGAGYLPYESGYGKITLIQHSNGIISAYAHQATTLVRAGQRVRAGQVIGLVGSTGRSTGPHLHLEVRTALHGGQINPLVWLRQRGVRI